MASSDGTVSYINKRAGASNYGKYVVLKHVIEGIEVFTLYAHLSDFAPGLAAGKSVKARRNDRDDGPHQQYARTHLARTRTCAFRNQPVCQRPIFHMVSGRNIQRNRTIMAFGTG